MKKFQEPQVLRNYNSFGWHRIDYQHGGGASGYGRFAGARLEFDLGYRVALLADATMPWRCLGGKVGGDHEECVF